MITAVTPPTVPAPPREPAGPTVVGTGVVGIALGQRDVQLTPGAPVRHAGLLAVTRHLDRGGAPQAWLAEAAVHREALGRPAGGDARGPFEIGAQLARRYLEQPGPLPQVESADRRERIELACPQHLGLVDVADAARHALVEQRLAHTQLGVA